MAYDIFCCSAQQGILLPRAGNFIGASREFYWDEQGNCRRRFARLGCKSADFLCVGLDGAGPPNEVSLH